jgi:hypothetical protein
VIALVLAATAWGEGASDPIAAEARSVFDELETRQPRLGWISVQDGAGLAWSESYRLMAYVAMYEATGEHAYLDEAALRIDAVLERRDDARGCRDEIRDRVSAAWSSTKYTNGRAYAWIVHAGMITYPIARWAYLVRRDSSSNRDRTERAGRYVAAVRETIDAFDGSWREGPGRGEGHYRGEFLGRPLPLNQQNALGRALVAMWLATGEEGYRRRAEALARTFRNRMRFGVQGASWPYWPEGRDTEDVSHAAINADFAVACHRAGIVFSRQDMRALSLGLRRYLGEARRGDDRRSAQIGRWARVSASDGKLRAEAYEFMRPMWEVNRSTGLLAAAYFAHPSGGGAGGGRERPIR